MSTQPDTAATRPAPDVAAGEVVNLSETIVLKQDNLFLVSLRDGRIPLAGGHPLGLYFEDCRFLSGHELRIGSEQPRLLIASAPEGHDAVHELTNPDLRLPGGRRLPLQSLQVRLDRTVADQRCLWERIHVHHYGHEPLQLELVLVVAADFVPMLSVRGMVDLPPPAVSVEELTAGLRFVAHGRDGMVRATTVGADPVPTAVEGGMLRFELDLEPGGRADVQVCYDLHQDPEDPPAHVARDDRPARLPGQAWLARGTQVVADERLFGRIMRRSLLDMRMLRSTLDDQRYHAAGVPWFATLFGRDSLIAALQMLPFEPDLAAQTLRLLAGRLGRRLDPAREEEPGKVLHELRVGELAALELTPLTRYYGSVDATPLFLCVLAEHAAWSGDLGLFQELRGAVDGALGWIDDHGDHDGDGLLDYACSSPDGLRNQGWKDSDDGVIDEHGRPLEPPIALVEPQGYTVRAKRAVAELFACVGEPERAARLRAEADAMAARLERFWLAERGFYSMALDRDGRASGVLASNQGHLLWAGAVEPDRARMVRDALMSEPMFSGWGIRTLARGEPCYSPVTYHLGTIWPHDTALAAAGMRRYGFDDDFLACFEALLEAASHVDGYRLPELFAGFSRRQFETPVPYPVACHPQAWAAGTVPYLLTTGLGLVPDALDGRLLVRRPSLPSGVDNLLLENLRVGRGRVDLAFERAKHGHVALVDARVRGDVEVVLAIAR